MNKRKKIFIKYMSNKLKREAFKNLYDYNKSYDFHCGMHSNFTGTISIVSNSSKWEVKIINTSYAEDYPFIKKLYDNQKNISEMNKARKILKLLDVEDRDILLSAFSDEINKLSLNLKSKCNFSYKKTNINLAILCIYNSKIKSLKEVELYFSDKENKENIKELFNKSKQQFNLALEKYYLMYKEEYK